MSATSKDDASYLQLINEGSALDVTKDHMKVIKDQHISDPIRIHDVHISVTTILIRRYDVSFSHKS